MASPTDRFDYELPDGRVVEVKWSDRSKQWRVNTPPDPYSPGGISHAINYKVAEFILKQFGVPQFGVPQKAIPAIPPQVMPLESVPEASPEKLRRLGQFIGERGGTQKFEEFLNSLLRRGISVLEYLGGGAWGEVFRASLIARDAPVALKILKPPYDSKWLQRFKRETRILQSLAGETNIPSLIGTIEETQGLLFFQMELVEGTPLSALEFPVEITQALSLVRQTLKTLGMAHAKGVIHRDLHLGNVIKTDNGIVLLDFGLAREEGGVPYSKSFKPVGAMSHCAPEKWLDPSSAGVPSDIFSIGVMLYKMLTGEMPFWADTYIELYETIKAGSYTPASSRVPEMPPFIDLLIQEMLYPSLAQRIPDTKGVLQLLDHIEPLVDVWKRQRGS